MRHGDWKLVRMGQRLRTGNAKWELYDLSQDASEETNLAATQPERLADLITVWEKLNSQMSAPLF